MMRFTNFYDCQQCGASWADTSECTNDDRCIECNLPCSPTRSEDITPMMFINYTPATGVTVNTFRRLGAYYGEISDVALAVTYNHESCCCALDGAKAALEDGEYWQGSRATPEALEMIHAAITEATQSNPVLRSRTAPDA